MRRILRGTLPRERRALKTSSATLAPLRQTCCCRPSAWPHSCFPLLTFLLAWKWIRSEELEAPGVKIVGATLLALSAAAALSFGHDCMLFGGAVRLGGVTGLLLANWLTGNLNLAGAVVATAHRPCRLRLPGFQLQHVEARRVVRRTDGVARRRWRARWRAWREAPPQAQARKGPGARQGQDREARQGKGRGDRGRRAAATLDEPPFDPDPLPETAAPAEAAIDGHPHLPARRDLAARAGAARPRSASPWPPRPRLPTSIVLPSTDLLNEPPGRNPYDEQELKEIAGRIKSKFEEFNVLGSVVQINPGPVVTTFEFKPEAGIKYSRITTLTEDLCLGLQAESILIERIPGKPTVGIEVPNTKRELISLRQMLESDEFTQFRLAPHHSAGQGHQRPHQGGGARRHAAPADRRLHRLGQERHDQLHDHVDPLQVHAGRSALIMVDPKRLELGLYEGIPHLLTPVITDPKKATNALRNAVLEMERRLRLLAEQGVRNIDQYNRKIRKLQERAAQPVRGRGRQPPPKS